MAKKVKKAKKAPKAKKAKTVKAKPAKATKPVKAKNTKTVKAVKPVKTVNAKPVKQSAPAKKKTLTKAQAVKKAEVRKEKEERLHKYSALHGFVLFVCVVLTIIAGAALVYATVKFGQHYAALRRPTLEQEYGFISQIVICVTGLIAVLLTIINGLVGHKRSYRYIMWTIVAVAISSVTYIGAEIYYGLTFDKLICTTLIAMFVFAASQRLFNKRRTIGFLSAGFVISVVVSSLLTVAFINSKDFKIYLDTDLWYIISTYVMIWTRTILIAVLICSYLTRIYRIQKASAQKALDRQK